MSDYGTNCVWFVYVAGPLECVKQNVVIMQPASRMNDRLF